MKRIKRRNTKWGNDACAFQIHFQKETHHERENAERAPGGVKTPEEVVAIAKEHGKELTLEQAQALLDRVKNSVTGELSEDDLEAVGGASKVPLT